MCYLVTVATEVNRKLLCHGEPVGRTLRNGLENAGLSTSLFANLVMSQSSHTIPVTTGLWATIFFLHSAKVMKDGGRKNVSSMHYRASRTGGDTPDTPLCCIYMENDHNMMGNFAGYWIYACVTAT